MFRGTVLVWKCPELSNGERPGVMYERDKNKVTPENANGTT